jgi:hypothetical protein
MTFVVLIIKPLIFAYSLNNLRTLYLVKEKYRRRQKNSAGNYIPFESIDKSIYTDQGSK